MIKSDGGYAFPIVDQKDQDGDYVDGTFGMTLRDYFAAKALPVAATMTTMDMPQSQYVKMVAVDSYLIADAMLKARAR